MIIIISKKRRKLKEINEKINKHKKINKNGKSDKGSIAPSNTDYL